MWTERKRLCVGCEHDLTLPAAVCHPGDKDGAAEAASNTPYGKYESSAAVVLKVTVGHP